MASSSVLIKLAACALAACMVLGAAEAAVTCSSVTKQLTPCLSYLTSGGAPTAACCGGVKSLNGMASMSTPDRQATCNCLKAASKGINLQNAVSLPAKCGVKIGYSISPNTDCSKVR
uniref:Non-specific lipid-transfer protein n=1 Tax=Tamarix hispida TaxID=189793 RepID=C0KHK4_9CARY|nr:non-specific lipid-transfer protein type 1 [Tamarix hispida]